MKCLHCYKNFKEVDELWELAYMIGKSWLFYGIIKNNIWKTDLALVEWVEKGWVEFNPRHWFKITELGISATKLRNEPLKKG